MDYYCFHDVDVAPQGGSLQEPEIRVEWIKGGAGNKNLGNKHIRLREEGGQGR